MTRQAPAPIDRFIEAADEMRTLLPEMRAAIKDGRGLLKELRAASEEARGALTAAAREHIDKAVDEQLVELKNATEQVITATMDNVGAKLDQLTYLLGLTDRRHGDPSLVTLTVAEVLNRNPTAIRPVKRFLDDGGRLQIDSTARAAGRVPSTAHRTVVED